MKTAAWRETERGAGLEAGWNGACLVQLRRGICD